MKTISTRELHERTGAWLREAAHAGEIAVTDRGRVIARILPAVTPASVPYFSRRQLTPAFRRLAGKLSSGSDSTASISQDRDR
ncbi:MAG: hypothetical protein ABIO49_03865 [Dokdonella sp.]